MRLGSIVVKEYYFKELLVLKEVERWATHPSTHEYGIFSTIGRFISFKMYARVILQNG